MCTSPDVDSSGSDFAQRQATQARLDEAQRQQRINYGLHVINSVFNGGQRHTNMNSWLAARGALPAELWEQFSGVSGDARDEFMRENGVTGPYDGENYEGDLFGARGQPKLNPYFRDATEVSTTSSPGFDPLIERRRQAQLDFQLPQLQERFGEGRDDLAFSLARAGLSNSSVAANRQAKLGRMFQLEDAKVRSGVESDIANLRSRISQARQSVEAQLRASADPSAAINTALSEQSRFYAEQPERTTIGDVFAPIAQGIGQAYNTYQTGRLSSRLNQILTSGATGQNGSGRVVT